MSEYKKLTEADLEEIAKIVPRERILWADEVNEEYSHDELSATPSYPDLVVRVTGFTAYFCSLTPEFRKLVVDRILIQGGA